MSGQFRPRFCRRRARAVATSSQFPGASTTSNTLPFTVYATPTIGSFTPTQVSAGSPDLTISATGTNFVNGITTVTWCNGCGGSPTNLSTTVGSSTQLTAVVPAALLTATATANLGIAEGNYAANVTSFNVRLPTVSSISPTSTPALGPSFVLTVNGTNFVSGVSTVTFAGTPLVTTFISANQVTATVSSTLIASNGTATVAVQNGSSAPSSTNATFTITVPTPAVTVVNPSSAVAGSGNTSITVSGSNFLNGVSTATWCSTNTSPCSGTLTNLATTFVSNTSLTAVVPTAQLTTSNTFYVGVTNTNGGSAASPYPFVVTSPTTTPPSAPSPPPVTLPARPTPSRSPSTARILSAAPAAR